MSACLTGIIGLAAGFTTFSSHAVQLDTVTVIGCNGTLITDGYGREMCVRDGGGGGGGSGGVIRGDYGGGGGGRGGVGVTDTAIGYKVVTEKPCSGAEESTERPVIIPTGNKVLVETDFGVPPVSMPLQMSRNYDKTLTRIGIFGRNWSSNIEQTLSFDYNGTQCHGRLDTVAACAATQPLTQIYANRNGFGSIYTKDSNGIWTNAGGSTITASGSNWILTAPNGDRHTYDANGRPLTIKDERGIGLTYAYASNKLATITHTSGRAIQLTWNGAKIASIAAPNGKIYSYGYDGNGYLATATYPDSLGVRTYHYEDAAQPGGLTGISINGTRYSRYAYNADGRAAWSGLEGGIERSTFTYGADYTDVKNALGQTTRYQIAELGGSKRVIGVERPASPNCPAGATNTMYDAKGNVDYELDAYDVKTDYTYDADGRITRKITGIGPNGETDQQQITDFVWDATRKSRLLSIKVYGNALTQPISETAYTYYPDGDAKARLLKSVSVKNLSAVGIVNATRITSYTYTLHAGSPMIATITVDGPLPGVDDVVVSTYDTAGNLIQTRNSLDHTTTYASYNALGQPGRVTNANGAITDYTYNARGDVLTVKNYIGAVAHTTSNIYDNRGRLVKSTTPDTVATNYEYDNYDRLINVFKVEPESSIAALVSLTGATSPVGQSVILGDGMGTDGVCADCPEDPGGDPPPPAPTNGSSFVSQTVPASMLKGQTYPVVVRMKNTGTTTWTAATNYRLGSINDNTIWGLHRVSLPASIAPGATAAFSFNVTAPIAVGTYNFQWRMVRDGVAWFGPNSANVAVGVNAPPPPPLGFQRFTYNLASQVTKIETGIEYTPESSSLTGVAMSVKVEDDGMMHPNLCYPYPDCIPDPPDPGPTAPPRETLILTSSYIDYDAGGFVSARRGNHSQNVRYFYNANGDLSKITDSLGRNTLYAYDRQRRVNHITDAKNGHSWMTYDPLGRLVEAKDPRGLSTTYAYDGFGQLWQQTSPDTGTTLFEYSPEGLRTRLTRADGSFLAFTYDGLGRLTWSGDGMMGRTYGYDWCAWGKGQLCSTGARISATENNQTQYAYTARGLLWKRLDIVDGSQDITVYGNDGMDRLVSITYPSGVSVGYDYVNGRLSAVTYKNSPTSATYTLANDFQYQPFGPVTGWTYANGLNRRYAYDLDGRLTGLSVGAGSVVRQSLTYGYNANNEMTAITDGAIGSVSTTYTYDELSRLKTQTWPSNGFVDAWSYDATGNRTSHTWNQAPSTLSNDPASNRLQLLTRSGAPDQAFEYDPRGNITATAGTSYAYDAFNRMQSASRAAAATVTEPNYANHTYPAGTTSYSYNAQDQRVAKSGASGTTRFIYSGQNQLLAENGPGGWRSYIWAGNELLGVINPNGYTYYIHTNHLGKPESATHQNKTMVWRSYNWAFDRHIPLDNIGGLNIGFPGQYYDAETGNWYNGFRDYDGRLGRYLQSDPIGLEGGSNTYSYAYGNPLLWIDPYGLENRGKQVAAILNVANSARLGASGLMKFGVGAAASTTGIGSVPGVGAMAWGAWNLKSSLTAYERAYKLWAEAATESTKNYTAKDHLRTLVGVLPFGTEADDPCEPTWPEVLKNKGGDILNDPIHSLSEWGTMGF